MLYYDLDPKLDSVCEFEDGTMVDAVGIAKILRKHLRFRDRFNLAKVVVAAMYAFDHLAGPENVTGDNLPDPGTRWKFNFIDKSDYPTYPKEP